MSALFITAAFIPLRAEQLVAALSAIVMRIMRVRYRVSFEFTVSCFITAGNARCRAGYRSIDIFFRSLTTTTSEREISCLGIKDFLFFSFNYEIFRITRFAHASSGVIVHLYDNARMPALYSHGTPSRNAFSQSSDLANARSSTRMPITKEASPLWIDESHGRFNENHLDADLALIKTS